MISRLHLMAIGFGLAAWFWCTAGAFAQTGAAMPPERSRAAAAAVVTKDFPWHTVEWIERRYKIEAMHFKAQDETGVDWWGSDEVMIETVDAKGWTVSDEIGDIDSGDTHHFDPAKSCIVAVRAGTVVLGKTSVCDDVGEPAPLSFQVEFWEKDPIGISIGFCNRAPPGPGGHKGPRDCANDGNGDDFIGRRQLDFLAHDFEAVLPNVGDTFIETVALNPCGDADVCDVTFGANYSFTYLITRLPDVRVGLRSVLDEAMRRSGARTELEAIVAGLRSLRAPIPRKVEAETVTPPSKR